MTERRVIKTERAPKPGGAYSQGIVAGDFVFTAGQGGGDPGTGKLAEGVEAQTRNALNNVRAVLEAGGSSLEQVVKVTVFLSDIKNFAKMNEVYLQFFPRDQPARSTVEGNLGGLLIEVDAIGFIPRA